MIRGAIFDMDGTLVDSMPAWATVGDQLLLSHGVTPPKNLAELLKTMSLDQSLAYLTKETGLVITRQEFLDGVDEIMLKRYRTDAPLKPHAIEFLEALKARGVRCCVATATRRPAAVAVLDRTGIAPYLEFLITCEEAGAGKERPDIFLAAMEKLGTSPQDTVVFEDALHAVETASKAGLRVVAVADDHAAADREAITRMAEAFYLTLSECEVASL